MLINIFYHLNLVVFESNKVIVKSDRAFFSQRLDNNRSEICAGRKTSGSLKLKRVTAPHVELFTSEFNNGLIANISRPSLLQLPARSSKIETSN